MTTTVETLLAPSLIVALLYVSIVATAAIVAAIRLGGRREDTVDHNDALSLSRFTIPVSVIVPAGGDSEGASRSIEAILELNYPELDIVVMIEDVERGRLASFCREWQLEAHEFFYRRSIETAPVRRIYRSARDSRLMVVDKAAQGYADAANCGVNIARYRYVAILSPGIVFDANALLRIMAAPLRDPATVVAASNHVEPTGRFERLASVRSLMASRLVWRDRGSLGPPSSAVTVWRRDAVLEAKGFSATAADPDIDLARRVLVSTVELHGRRFHRGTDVFGRRPAAPTIASLARAIQHHVALLAYVRALNPAGVRALGGGSLAWLFGSDVVAPLAQIWVVAGTLAGAGMGWLSWTTFAAALLFICFARAAVTTAALLLRGATAGSPGHDELKALILCGPAESLLYPTALLGAGIAASFQTSKP